jgi:hypothetical protein
LLFLAFSRLSVAKELFNWSQALSESSAELRAGTPINHKMSARHQREAAIECYWRKAWRYKVEQ